MSERRTLDGLTVATFTERQNIPEWGERDGSFVTQLTVADERNGEIVTFGIAAWSDGRNCPHIKTQVEVTLDSQQLDVLIARLEAIRQVQKEYQEARREWEDAHE